MAESTVFYIHVQNHIECIFGERKTIEGFSLGVGEDLFENAVFLRNGLEG